MLTENMIETRFDSLVDDVAASQAASLHEFNVVVDDSDPYLEIGTVD